MPPSGGWQSGLSLALGAFLDDLCFRLAGQATGQPVNLATATKPTVQDKQSQACRPPPPDARSSCPSCRVRRGRVRGEGQDGWGVLVGRRPLASQFSRCPAPPPAVAGKAEGTGGEQDEREGSGTAERVIELSLPVP